jgi:hypothetical protein
MREPEFLRMLFPGERAILPRGVSAAAKKAVESARACEAQTKGLLYGYHAERLLKVAGDTRVVRLERGLVSPRCSPCTGSGCAGARRWPFLHSLVLRWCSQVLSLPHSLHWLLLRSCMSMLSPPHSLQQLRMRWRAQMADPLHSLQWFRMRWSSQILPFPQSWLRLRWCALMANPQQSIHVLLCRWCSHVSPPPHSLHRLRMRWCLRMLPPPQSLHGLRWCVQVADLFVGCRHKAHFGSWVKKQK